METENKPEQKATPPNNSPKWSWTTKLVIGLVLAVIALLLVVRFQNFLGPLIMSFIIAYLFYPLANFLRKTIKIRWRGAVAIIYILVALIIIGLLTWGGVALITQVQNLITFIQKNIDTLPALIEELSEQTLVIGPFEIYLPTVNWDQIISQVIGAIQPILGTAGSLMGKLVSGGANMVFWILITLLVSFFILSETEGTKERLISLKIPNYTDDLKRMGEELSRIWNAFIRGELIVVGTAIVVYTALLGALGVQYYYVLALVAGFGRFIPYLGAWISWISFGLVALLQPSNYFGLEPGWYALIVVVISLIVDNILDHILTPRVMGNALKVHPAAILIAALIGANLLGLVGVILAAPVFATIQLIVRYLLAKMADKDPWEGLEYLEQRKIPRWMIFVSKVWKKFVAWIKKLFKRKPPTPKTPDVVEKIEKE